MALSAQTPPHCDTEGLAATPEGDSRTQTGLDHCRCFLALLAFLLTSSSLRRVNFLSHSWSKLSSDGVFDVQCSRWWGLLVCRSQGEGVCPTPAGAFPFLWISCTASMGGARWAVTPLQRAVVLISWVLLKRQLKTAKLEENQPGASCVSGHRCGDRPRASASQGSSSRRYGRAAELQRHSLHTRTN